MKRIGAIYVSLCCSYVTTDKRTVSVYTMSHLCTRHLPIIFLMYFAFIAASFADDRKAAAIKAATEMGREGQTDQREMTQQGENVVPAYQGAAVPESNYYSDSEAMPTQAVEQMGTTDGGKFINQSYHRRQHFNLKADTDPLLRLGKTIRDNPEDYAPVGDEGEGSCAIRERLTGESTFQEQYCTAWNASPRGCHHRCYCPSLDGELDISAHSDINLNYDYPYFGAATAAPDSWSGSCREYDREIRFNIADTKDIARWQLLRAEWTDHLRIVLNESQVFIGPHIGDRLQAVKRTVNVPVTTYRKVCRQVPSNEIYKCKGDTTIGTTSYCCENVPQEAIRPQEVWKADYGTREYDCAAGAQSTEMTVDLKPYLRAGENRLTVRTLVADSGGMDLHMRLQLPCDCRQSESVSDGGCQALAEQVASGYCQVTQSSCLEGTPRCGHEEQEHLCLGEQLTEESYCQELRDRGCAQINAYCVDSDEEGVCKEQEQKYRCPYQQASWNTVPDCGQRISCLAGDCFDTSYTSSDDFPLAASHLSALEEISSDFDKENLRVFDGQSRRCKKTVLGFANCCRDSGWGIDLGLNQCSRQEQELGEMRQQGLCHYVGSYKRGRLLSKKRYQSFCCFGSLLGRIVQEQGRDQLNRDWGSARYPSCQGFPIDDIGTLDFEQFDFSEFYIEAERRAESVDRPTASELGNRMKERIRQLSTEPE